jgi:phospholipid N-methyltransferase
LLMGARSGAELPHRRVVLMFKRGTRAASITSQVLLFANNFFKHPAMLGSIVPSSPFLVNDVLAQVDWQKAEVLVEYGPGVGTITQEILKRMRPDARLVVIELNPQFVEFLQARIQDPRLHVVLGSASEARKVLTDLNLARASYIISGIPYSLIPDPVRREILEQARQILTPDGALLVYQFTDAVLPYLQSSFGSVQQNFQFWNILPARIFYCTP